MELNYFEKLLYVIAYWENWFIQNLALSVINVSFLFMQIENPCSACVYVLGLCRVVTDTFDLMLLSLPLDKPSHGNIVLDMNYEYLFGKLYYKCKIFIHFVW
jgi:hypothetical protein